MEKILVLWAIPRSTSTAFEWMMRMRGDMACFHEPFGEPWYKGEQPLWPRLKADSPRTPGLTFDSVLHQLDGAARAGPVFVKDFPHYVRHMWAKPFLDRFNHSFLIRDPAKVISSLSGSWPHFLLSETGFLEQRQLFDRLVLESGTIPPVIDSDDLLQDPDRVVAAYCEAVGIRFLPEALSWQPGDREEVSWYDGGSWHNNLRKSTGLKPQSRRHVGISELPQSVRQIYDMCLPDYEHLYQHRLSQF